MVLPTQGWLIWLMCYICQSLVKGPFHRLQKEYLFPVIHTAYVHQQKAFLEGKQLYLSGDGRCDSLGYSAKYCTYSIMDNATDLILDYSLVQVTETGSSVTMEKEGVEHCLTNVWLKMFWSNSLLLIDIHQQVP